mgnify:CR=1 FL=1
MTRTTRKHVPYPEIVSGEAGWTIHEEYDAPATNNLDKKMYVPLDGKCIECKENHSKMIRRHELGHVKWSPKTMGRLKENESAMAIELCEEVRVHYLLNRHGLFIDKPVRCVEDTKRLVAKLIYTSSVADMVKYLLACAWDYQTLHRSSWGVKEPDSIEWNIFMEIYQEVLKRKELTYARELDIDWAIEKAKYFYLKMIKNHSGYSLRQKVSYNHTRKIAKELAPLLAEFAEKPVPEEVLEALREQQPNSERHDEACECETCELEEEKERKSRSYNRRDKELSVDDLYSRNKKEIFDRTQHGNTRRGSMNYKIDKSNYKSVWGDMKIHNPELVVNLQGRIKGGRKYRPMDYGTIPRYMNRYCIDKQVFSQKQRVYGGTVLIDASGSMSFNGQDILDIMQQVPAVTIAMYNGSYDKGDLRIIAKNGKRVDEEYLDIHSGHGNVIDGMALRWLANQPPKRIWVSDMYVFGRHNDNGYGLLQDCKQIMLRNGIMRLADIDEVKRFALELNKVQ